MDALEKMNKDIRAIAEQVGEGNIFYPSSKNPVIIVEVIEGKVVEVTAKIDGSEVKYQSD